MAEAENSEGKSGPTQPAPATVAAGWGGALTRFAAVAGSLVALGQSASTWIDGRYHAEMEREKTRRELQLADLKERSDLAESYLKLILAKDTPEDGRAILYSALAQVKGHPLQQWAQSRYDAYTNAQQSLGKALSNQAEVATQANDANGTVRTLEADIEALNARRAEAMDKPTVRDALQAEIVSKSAALGRARAALTLATLAGQGQRNPSNVGAGANGTGATATAGIQGASPDPVARIETFTQRLTPALLGPLFPGRAAGNIEANLPFLRAALQEFNVSDPKLIAAIVATIAVETPSFGEYDESASAAEKYDHMIGNNQPGDAVKFRGRGLIGLTGKDNYARVSKQLGLGTRLLDSPDDAKSPEVASRVLVDWFVERRPQFSAALAAGDFATVRKLVTGGTRGLPQFVAAYQHVLSGLTGVAVPAPASAASAGH